MAATPSGEVWAVGTYHPSDQPVPLVAHWDGSSWTMMAVAVGNQGTGNLLSAVGAAGSGQAWAVGYDSALTATFAAPVPVVPGLNGYPVGQAEAVLATYGLRGGRIYDTQSCLRASDGTIVGSAPGGGQQYSFGQPVDLTLCDLATTVPNVYTYDDATARATITGAGLTVGTVDWTPNCTLRHGDVLSQHPDPGQAALRGDPVNLTESTGKQGNGKPCIVN